LPKLTSGSEHNAHMFYVITNSEEERDALRTHLAARGIMAAPHYVPLHSSYAGVQFGTFFGEDLVTTATSQRLLRLPMWNGISKDAVVGVTEVVVDFFCG
jgi:dTDP-4-amino-4,6-dideoxygalactose transaminase